MRPIHTSFFFSTTIWYWLAAFLERTVWFGWQALLMTYLFTDNQVAANLHLVEVMGWLMTGVVFCQLLGGILGDLVLGHSKAMLWGLGLQVVGVLLLYFSDSNVVYIGLVMLLLGGGLFTPNLLASYGKRHVHQPQLLDASFTGLYVVHNVGGFIGTWGIAYIQESSSWLVAFASLIMLLFLAGWCLIKSQHSTKTVYIEGLLTMEDEPSPSTKSVANFPKIPSHYQHYLLLAFVAVGVQEWTHALSFVHYAQHLQVVFDNYTMSSSLFSIVVLIIMAIAWIYFYSHALFKLTLGCCLLAASYGGMLLFSPAFLPSLGVILCWTVGIAFITPVLHTLVTRYTSTQYLAIWMSLVALLPEAIHLIVQPSYDFLVTDSNGSLILSLYSMIPVSLFLVYYYNNIFKKNEYNAPIS